MIKVENLVKSFGAKRAVDDISFSVERGEVLGFLGPNGAGKSTTMRIITGFYPPTAGRVTVGGFDIVEDPLSAKRLIGYLPENAPGYADMTVHGFLAFAAELRGLAGDAKKKAIQPRGRNLFPRERAVSDHRYAVERLQAPHLPRAIDHPRSRYPDPRRADRRPRPQPEARSARTHQAHGREQGDRVLDAYPRGSRSGVHARDHHRSRQNRRQRHAAGIEGAFGIRGRRAARHARRCSGGGGGKIGRARRTHRNPVGPRRAGRGARLSARARRQRRFRRQHRRTRAARDWKLDEIHVEEGRLDEVFRSITLPDTVQRAA